jgi:predicted dithiol-disulfide oxidoreductase (DUF899 family)
MLNTPVVSQDEWIAARVELMKKEKQLTRARDELSRARRELPRVKVDKEYVFQTDGGERTLPQLFEGRSQLIVYHFMFGPEWDAGCPSCSFWCDSYNGTPIHLANRDTTFTLCSRAQLDKVQAYRKRMGWELHWVSSYGSDFNFDFGVSFTPEQEAEGAVYNFAFQKNVEEELPGITVFARVGSDVYRTYSAYSRGIDVLNVTYQLLDLTPKGRDEDNLPFPAAWLRRHDEYDS